MTFKVIDTSRGNDRTVETRQEAEEKKNDMISLGARPEDIVIEEQSGNPETEVEDVDAEVIRHTEEATEVVEPQQDAEVVETTEPDAHELSTNPVEYLREINTDFVNTIKGTPAISKQGFRFIQRQFEISTEAEVVQWVDDPLGCIVWAKAEHPSGYSAEAHGEGYKFEGDVSDNEFARYADTRAKNRALSDLTSAGALAVSELSDAD